MGYIKQAELPFFIFTKGPHLLVVGISAWRQRCLLKIAQVGAICQTRFFQSLFGAENKCESAGLGEQLAKV